MGQVMDGVRVMTGVLVRDNLDAERGSLEPLSPQDRLAWAHQRFGSGFALTTSVGIHSAVLLHMTVNCRRVTPSL